MPGLPPHPRPPRAVGLVLLALALGAPAAAPAQAAQASAIAGLARDLAGELAPLRVEAVAVVDFTDLHGRPTELGRYVAVELAAALGDAAPELEIVDRSHLAPVLAEKNLAATGLIDAEELRAAVQLAGIDALVTGRLTPFADTVRLQAVVLSAASAEQLAHAEADLPRTRTIEELEARSLRVGGRLVEGFPVAATASFEGISETVRTIRLLELHAYGFKVQFAGVPIE